MGVFQHHAIIVTFPDSGDTGIYARNIHSWASSGEDPLPITQLMNGRNGICSFAVLPDGSKEGWERSMECDDMRQQLIEQLDRDSCIDWVEISFGEERNPRVSRASEQPEDLSGPDGLSRDDIYAIQAYEADRAQE